MFACWTPSLEFIPDCRNFLMVLQDGLGQRERGFEGVRKARAAAQEEANKGKRARSLPKARGQ